MQVQLARRAIQKVAMRQKADAILSTATRLPNQLEEVSGNRIASSNCTGFSLMAPEKRHHRDKENLVGDAIHRNGFLRFMNGVLQKSSVGDSATSNIVLRGNGDCKRNESTQKKSKIMRCDSAQFYDSSNGSRCISNVLSNHLEVDVKKVDEVMWDLTKQANKIYKCRRHPMKLRCNHQLAVSSSPAYSLRVRNRSKGDGSNGETRLNGLKSCELTVTLRSNCLKRALKEAKLVNKSNVSIKDSTSQSSESFTLPNENHMDMQNKTINAREADTDSKDVILKEEVAQDKVVVNESDAEEEPDPLFGFDNGMYEVQSIIAKRKRKGTRLNEYYIKWVGWPYRTCTWELASDFGEVSEVRAEFDARERALAVVMEQPDHRFLNSRIRQLHSLARWESAINAILRSEGRQILYIYNDVDDERARHDFTYIISNKYPPEMECFIRRAQQSNACSCGAACGSGQDCCPAKEGHHFFYTKRNGIKSKFYADEKSELAGMLVECNEECKCDDSCPTKVVQKGRRYKVAIVRRKKCGWGIVALEAIASNTFVVEYVGEVGMTKRLAIPPSPSAEFEWDSE
ncbi:Histone-lysine N-methyltransferase SUV39H2 [Toxocara canis]|uniref:Histone-lysine N-methyltransferase SUV39H2 n=1 Tax=Toxocara canis TaxID=6265 RepID=A0A0B2V1F7_TOXCA|nr:Histone-lysine N-methyltransferase SUV39H2 [Toxocara canis]